MSTGLKTGVNEKNAGTSLPDALSRLAKRSSHPIRLRSGHRFARDDRRSDQELASARFPMKKRRKPQCPPITSSPLMVLLLRAKVVLPAPWHCDLDFPTSTPGQCIAR